MPVARCRSRLRAAEVGGLRPHGIEPRLAVWTATSSARSCASSVVGSEPPKRIALMASKIVKSMLVVNDPSNLVTVSYWMTGGSCDRRTPAACR